VFTHGDFLRWLTRQTAPNLHESVSTILNRSYISASLEDSPQKLKTLLQRVKHVPLLDDYGRLVALARPREARVKLGPYTIDDTLPSFIIAEIGINHNGSLATAKQLIEGAAQAGANCAKFQMRSLKTLYLNQGNPNDSSENLGSQYTLDLLTRFQLSVDE